MKYFLIAGEASGDLHASHLMRALQQEDPEAQFRFYGGDLMKAAGGQLLCHYKNLAYMGFIPVLLHAHTILQGMKTCKRQIEEWQPDAVILVDYPGFNLKIAHFVRQKGICPVYYYISPKIWAWKEHRIKDIRKTIDRLFSILPFEVDFFEKKHHYPISYVGNPTLDEVHEFLTSHSAIPRTSTIAILAGSRMQEIKDNLSRMLEAAAPFCQKGYRIVICGAPSIPSDTYDRIVRSCPVPKDGIEVVYGKTYETLCQSQAALVTSGTATLETALFNVPQVVCYYVACGKFISFLRRHLLKVPYISLVNLICQKEVVPELVADGMTVSNVRTCLSEILPEGNRRAEMLKGYRLMTSLLGEPGAPQRAAREIKERTERHKTS